ncbi:MAG: GAF domain-containing protein [Solirubrobacteraceae bacterium]
MATTVGAPAYRERRFPRLVGRLAALGRHRVAVIILVVLSIAGALVLDLAFPSYPIAGFYLVPVTLAALTLRVRETILVSVVCLGLALYVVVIQDRMDGPTITVVCLIVLSGAALIALSYLFKQVDQLYETERSTTEMLESLAAQLQTLQEVVVLDSARPLSDLLRRVIDQASQLLGSDGCAVYRYDPELEALGVAATTGEAPQSGDALPLRRRDDPIVRALAERTPIVGSGGTAGGALLAVPLLVRSEAYGVLVLTYRRERAFNDLDTRLAASFGGQVALAIENARLRDEVELNAAASERSRLARDLHDSVTQSLFAASLKAEAVRRRWQPATPEARRNVEDVERLARGALAEMRTLLMEMRPRTLAEASLGTLLEQLAAASEGSSRVTVDAQVRGARQLPPDVSIALYRIAQEALSNVGRHSGADTAWVMLDLTGASVRLSVRDDGRGFDAGKVTPEHLGLAMMRERGEDAGISVRVESTPGGTTVTAVWTPDEDAA